MNRRQFLSIAGGGIILAAGSASAAFLMTRRPDQALAPWAMAGSAKEDPRRAALSYAILAPNPHNRQPWMVDLTTAGQVTLYVDPTRMLPHTDPFNRQITIGLGCFLEVMAIAASHLGHRVDFTLFPEGSDETALDRRPVAVARFHADATVVPDPLFAHILARRSLKEPYDLNRTVPNDAIASLTSVIRNGTTAAASNDTAHVAGLRTLTHQALEIEVVTPRTYKESVDLFRIGKAEIEANPDGIDFGGPLFDSLAALGQFDRGTALDTGSAVYSQGLKAVMDNADTAMAHIWLNTAANTRSDQINAGRDWVRVNLAATAAGLGIQPLSQLLQEYPEMADLYRQIHKQLAPQGGTVQMLGRLGYGPSVDPSPRWPLDAKIIS